MGFRAGGRDPAACFAKELRFYPAVGNAAGGGMNSREPGANYWLLRADLKASLPSHAR